MQSKLHCLPNVHLCMATKISCCLAQRRIAHEPDNEKLSSNALLLLTWRTTVVQLHAAALPVLRAKIISKDCWDALAWT